MSEVGGFFPQIPIPPGVNAAPPTPANPNVGGIPATGNGQPLLANVSIFKQVGAFAILWAVLAVGADSKGFGGLSAALAVTIATAVALVKGPAAMDALKGMKQ